MEVDGEGKSGEKSGEAGGKAEVAEKPPPEPRTFALGNCTRVLPWQQEAVTWDAQRWQPLKPGVTGFVVLRDT